MPSLKRRIAHLLIATTIVSAALFAARSADAALPLVVTSQEALDGLHEYSTVTVKSGGRLVVRPLGAGVGWLHLRANVITVESGGMIDATGAGYQGVDGSDGGQPSGKTGAGKIASGLNQPGTGGANAGDGGRGTTAGACSPIVATPGGVAYAMAGSLEPGSAGGAAKVVDPSVPTRGGHGGGRITLEAAKITIDGAVSARGEDGLNPSNVGSGGGAGGVLQLISGDIQGAGMVSVRGGAGGPGAQNGGGGGGGLVLLSTTAPAAMLTVSFDVDGGPSGSCQPAGAGGKGALLESPLAACVDADKDGFNAATCGGDDCDDADPDIHPAKNGVAVLERCDGQDNDCSGSIDDALPPGACPGGTCQAGACVFSDAGAGGSDLGAAYPDHVEYIGGCAVALERPAVKVEVESGAARAPHSDGQDRGPDTSGGAPGVAAFAALLLLLRRGRGKARFGDRSVALSPTATGLDARRRAGHTGPSVRAATTTDADGSGASE